MFDDLDMPTIAIAGGFALLFLLACVLMLGRRRIARGSGASRRTSFHLVVIDPAIAEHGRAAWERSPSSSEVEEVEVDDAMVEGVTPLVTDHTAIGYAPVPRRLARGSTPAITSAPLAHAPTLPARPLGWGVPVAPSVTARMRAARRG